MATGSRMTTDTPPRGNGKDVRGRFLTGNIGGPGRPKGSRNRLGEHFFEALFDDWSKHGPLVIARVRESNPAIYLKIVASLLPQQMAVEVSNGFDEMNAQELRAYVAHEFVELSRDEKFRSCIEALGVTLVLGKPTPALAPASKGRLR